MAFSRNEVLTEMTDSIGAVFLGLTVGCARCHDHKFDDFSQADYYRCKRSWPQTHEHDIVLADPKVKADWETRTEKIQSGDQAAQAGAGDGRGLASVSGCAPR